MIHGQSLQELAQTIVSHASGKKDFVLPTRATSYTEGADNGILIDMGSDSFQLERNAQDQILTHLDIPRRFASRLQTQAPDLLVANMNRLTSLTPAAERRMVRVLEGRARAFLSDSYRRIDNEFVFDGLFPVLTRLGGQIESANVSEDYLNLQVIFHKTEGEIRKGDVVRYGVHLQNSEVGRGALVLRPLIYRLVCTNGMIIADHTRRQIHSGGNYIQTADDMSWVALSSETQELKTRATIAEMGEYLEALATPEKFAQVLGTLQDKADQPLPAEAPLVVESLAARYSLRENESNSVLMALAAGQDLSRWGLANAITQTANSATVYDRAVDLETLGGVIMGMPDKNYRALAVMPRKQEVETLEGEVVS